MGRLFFQSFLLCPAKIQRHWSSVHLLSEVRRAFLEWWLYIVYSLMYLLYHNGEELLCRRRVLLQVMYEDPVTVLCPAEKRGFIFFCCIPWFYCWKVKTANNAPWNLFNAGWCCHSCAEVSKILFSCHKCALVALRTCISNLVLNLQSQMSIAWCRRTLP